MRNYGSTRRHSASACGTERLKDEYKDPDVLPKVNKADMARTMKSIKEYLRSCCDVMRAPLAYVINKTIIDQIYGDYPKYVTPDLPPDKNKLHNEQSGQSVIGCTAEYEIENRSDYDILDQICKGTDLYPHVKQHKFKRDGRRVFYPFIPGG